jgi:dihydropteroate synthase
MTRKLFELDRTNPQVMGVLNVTPDSFSDGGQYFSGGKLDTALCRKQIELMIADGATIIDVGGESTRPGAAGVSTQQELDRVIPAIEILQDYDCVVSLDSGNPFVMREACKFTIGLINDVYALQREGALLAAASTGLPVCLMHMQGEPQTMQNQPSYNNVLDDVMAFLSERIEACVEAGMHRANILLDPGFGFGKTLQHNQRVMANLGGLQHFGLPVLVGVSRKSMVSQMLGGRSVNERLSGSLALAVMAVERGAWIVRAHDVKATKDAIMIAKQVMGMVDE